VAYRFLIRLLITAVIVLAVLVFLLKYTEGQGYDLNGDGIISTADLNVYREQPQDFNGDGIIDIFDAVIIARETVDNGAKVPGR